MSDAMDRLERWRLVLGGGEADGTGVKLQGQAAGMDATLEALYDSDRGSSLGSSSPRVHRWLGDIRTYFPRSTVQVMQRDAIERLGLQRMLLEPELLEQVEADVHLVATLLSLKGMIPAKTRDTARRVVGKVVEQVQRRLRDRLVAQVRGAIDRGQRNHRPKLNEIDWDRTVRKNLRTWDPARRVLVPEKLVGHGRRGRALKHVVLCVDQSGSMATSVVYAGIFAAVLASIPAVGLRMAVFDTALAEVTEHVSDPVDLLFSTQLGGGTDIDMALTWVQGTLEKPSDTVVVLITDLFEGGNQASMLRRAAAISATGATCICLLALSDSGAPGFDRSNAQHLTDLGWATFACTPDAFPELLAAALARRDLGRFVGGPVV
jgi:Mg-chelatase subunit ChlD